MKGKFDSLLYSVVGVIAVLIILVAVNVLGGFLKFRSDLTENKLYTLSGGTKKILDKLDTPVLVRFYFSKNNASVPVPLRTYAQEVEDLLDEYQQYSHGKVKVIKLDPKPDSDAEDSANLDGIQGQDTDLGDKIYFGIAVSCLDAKTTIPFLSPDRETLLEYDLSRAISSVANPKKAVIGVMSALPVTGSETPPMMMMQERQEPTPPWIFLTELKENYTVRDIPLTADKIDDMCHYSWLFSRRESQSKRSLPSINSFCAEAKLWLCSTRTHLSKRKCLVHMAAPPVLTRP
jgi:ABC-type uncharacterized transport system involved in gliding motility auxiliary subunit